MILNVTNIIEITKHLRLDQKNGWKEVNLYTLGTGESDLFPGDQIQFEYFFFPETKDEIGVGLNFQFIDQGKKAGPEFSSKEVEQFLKDGTFVLVDDLIKLN